jgi:hypothetical protein
MSLVATLPDAPKTPTKGVRGKILCYLMIIFHRGKSYSFEAYQNNNRKARQVLDRLVACGRPNVIEPRAIDSSGHC